MVKDDEQLARRFAALSAEARSGFLSKLQAAGLSFAELPIVAADRHGDLPLSYAQRGLWLTWRLDPASPAYNMPGALHLSGPLSIDRLKAALDGLALRHEVLRTTYPAGADGSPIQMVAAGQAIPLPIIDLSGSLSSNVAETLRGELEAFSRQPFALDTEPPWRAALWRLSDQQHVLGLSLHHIAGDGGSIRILVDELFALFEAAAGGSVGLDALPIQWADYAVWQRNWFEAGERDRQVSHWRTRLGTEHAPLELPLDRPRGASRDTTERRHRFHLPMGLSQDLRRLAGAHGASVFMVVLALLKLTLYRFSGQADLRIGSPIAQRHRLDTRGLIGYLTNMQVLHTRLDARRGFIALVEAVRDTVLDAQAHPDLPFDLLVEALQPERLPGVNPLFQVKCTQQDELPACRCVAGLDVRIEELSGGRAHFDLSLDFVDGQSGIGAVFSYAAALFDETTVARIADALVSLAGQVVLRPHEPLCGMTLPEPLAMLGGPSVAWPHADVLDAWSAAVARYPTRLAVRDESRALTFAELDARADALADTLVSRGAGPESRIGLLAERSCEFVLGLLAVLKAGGAYVPLDPRLPPERLAYQVADSGAQWLLADRQPSWSTDLLALPLALPLALDAVQHQPLDRRSHRPHSRQGAYLIYTSGSTGQPKGVLVSRGALASYVQAVLARMDLPDEASTMAMVSTVAADLGHTSLFGALCSGRTLHLLGAERAFDPDRFAGYMSEHRVDVLKIVPSHLQALLQAADPAAVLPRHTLILGGEATSWSLLDRINTLRPECRVLNHYGPTETTVGALTQPADTACRAAATLPLGSPLGHAQAWVLDGELCPVPLGAAGELYLGGAGVARGYQGRPGLTAERFVASLAVPGERLYRTGDRVRWLADGSLEFLGRGDDQVKVRGYRVEVNEVAQALRAQAGIEQAEVVARPGDDGRVLLVAYVVPAGGAALEMDHLRASLARRLPDYMLPGSIVQLAALPLTANGKLDRHALPDPSQTVPGGREAPQGEVEQTLADVWTEVLRVPQVGRHDNFFELGGDSILTLQIVARVRKRGLRITPKQLMELQTVAALGAVAGRLASPADAGSPSAPNPGGATLPAPIELTPVQGWFFEQRFDEPWHWNQSVMLVPTEPVDPALLRSAVEHVVAHHEALRLCFDEHGGRWRQHAGRSGSEDCFEQVDWPDGLPSDAAVAAAVAQAAEQAQRASSLSRPFKAWWLNPGTERAGRLLLVAHHLVVDGVSWRVILDDLQTAYAQLRNGLRPQLQPVGTSFADWSRTLNGHARAEVVRAELDYWRFVTASPEPDLPGRAGGRNLVADARTVESRLDAEQTQRLLTGTAQAYRTQVNDILLTALARTLCAWDGRQSVLVEVEGHGREPADEGTDLSRTVGWFTVLYPLRLTPCGGGLGEDLKAVKEQLRKVPGKGLGYGILRYLGEEGRSLADGAYPQVSFNYLGQLDHGLPAGSVWRLAGEGVGAERSLRSRRRTWLDVGASVLDGELRMRWTYSAEVHDEVTMTGLAERFEQELLALVEHCTGGTRGVTPSDFPLARLTQSQLDQLPVPAAKLLDLYPLSPLQAGLLFHSEFATDGTPYVNQLRLDVEDLDPARFRAAWQAMFDRHDVLRTGFVFGDQPLQYVERSVAAPMSELDFSGRADPASALDALASAELERGFDLTAPPLMRLVLARVSANRHHLVWTRHHLLLDGWSTARLMSELLASYAGSALPPPAAPFRDHIACLQARDGTAAEAYWRALLAPVSEPTRLAAMLPPPAGGHGYHAHRHVLGAFETTRLEAFARAERVTLNTLVQAAWALLLRACGGPDVVCFGATSAGRSAEQPALEHTLGLFINTTPVVVTWQPQQRVGDWLRALQAQALASREHEHTPLADIQRWAGFGGQALFDSIVVFENYPVDEALRQPGAASLRFDVRQSREETHYPMTVTVQHGEALLIEYACQGQHVSPEQACQVAGRVHRLLHDLIDSSTRCLGDIAIVAPDEREQLRMWGLNTQRHVVDQPVHRLIERQAHARPQAIALIHDDERLSHAELNRRANRLAHRLMALGVKPEAKVGIAVERSIAMVVGLLAILKAGGAYVPLDPAYPTERLTHMMADSGIELLLTQRSMRERVPSRVTTLELDMLDLVDEPDTDPGVDVHGHAMAYLIFTSGSTGRPKGIAITHGTLAEHCSVAMGYFGLTPEDRMLQFSTINFDGFVEQLFPPLVTGATVVLRGPDLWDSETFYRELVDKRISIADLPTAYWHLLAQDFARQGPRDVGALRQVQATGEAMPADGIQAWRDAGLAHVKLLNTYGPTETVVTATAQDCLAWLGGESEVPALVPIGQPLAGRQIHVLDGQLNHVPPGLPGELYIGGELLARGYHGRPALSAERFVADPFGESGGRLYRTGDIARWNPSNPQGQLEYLGRADHQVKLRGFRVELGEIEAQLLAQPGVREAVVVALAAGPGGAKLVGYVSGNTGQVIDVLAMRDALEQALPEYMVPAVIMVLPTMPKNANGKIDRAALPAPEFGDDRGFEVPRGEAESALARIWAEVLGLDRVGRFTHFFELGGHSLAAMQVRARVRQLLSINMPLKTVFDHPRLADLAAWVLDEQARNQSRVTGDVSRMSDLLAALE